MFNLLKRIANKITMYLGLVDEIIIDFLVDMKSLRYQLVLWAFVLNAFVLYLIFLGKADYKLATVSIALLTAVYAFFFHSKAKQAEIENSQPTVSGIGDPDSTDRDPDSI